MSLFNVFFSYPSFHPGNIFEIYIFSLSPFPSNNLNATTHKQAITREALRREVRRFLLEIAPPNSTVTIPEDASLSEIFRAYYGPSASPARFIKVRGRQETGTGGQ